MNTERKAKVARTRKDNTSACHLTQSQFNRLTPQEKAAVYFSSDISRRAQADFSNNPKLALEKFAATLKIK